MGTTWKNKSARMMLGLQMEVARLAGVTEKLN